MGRRELEHTSFNQRTLGLESRIYHEATTGTSRYEAGTHAGLEGPHLTVINTAMRLAKAYARMYRQEWPLPDIDTKDGQEAFFRAQDGADWESIASELKYTSATEAQSHAVVYAHRQGDHDFLERCARAQRGAAPYRLRDNGLGWDEVARQTGIPVREVRVVAEAYAKSKNLPWPIKLMARQQEAARAEKAAQAYSLRAEHEKDWDDIAAELGWSHNTIRELAREHANKHNLDWPVVLNPITQEERLARGKEAYEKRLNDRAEWEIIGDQLGLAPSTVYKWARIYAEENDLQWPVWTADTLGQACYEKKLEVDGSWEEVGECFNVSGGHAANMARMWAETNGKPWPLPKKGNRSGEKAYRLRADQHLSWPDIGKSLDIGANTALSAASAYAEENSLPWPLHVERDIGPDVYQMRADTSATWLEISRKFGVTVGHAAKKAAHHAKATGKKWPLQAPPSNQPPHFGEQAYCIRRDEHLEWGDISTRLGISKSTAMDHAREWAATNGQAWPIPVPVQDTGQLAYSLRLQHLTWPQSGSASPPRQRGRDEGRPGTRTGEQPPLAATGRSEAPVPGHPRHRLQDALRAASRVGGDREATRCVRRVPVPAHSGIRKRQQPALAHRNRRPAASSGIRVAGGRERVGRDCGTSADHLRRRHGPGSSLRRVRQPPLATGCSSRSQHAQREGEAGIRTRVCSEDAMGGSRGASGLLLTGVLSKLRQGVRQALRAPFHGAEAHQPPS